MGTVLYRNSNRNVWRKYEIMVKKCKQRASPRVTFTQNVNFQRKNVLKWNKKTLNFDTKTSNCYLGFVNIHFIAVVSLSRSVLVLQDVHIGVGQSADTNQILKTTPYSFSSEGQYKRTGESNRYSTSIIGKGKTSTRIHISQTQLWQRRFKQVKPVF